MSSLRDGAVETLAFGDGVVDGFGCGTPKKECSFLYCPVSFLGFWGEYCFRGGGATTGLRAAGAASELGLECRDSDFELLDLVARFDGDGPIVEQDAAGC